jgi:tape measure domain-containing protein
MIVRIGADISDLRRSMSTVEREVNRVSSTFGNMGRTITASIGAIAGISVGVDTLKKGAEAGFAFNSAVEQASISFETLTGSAENAKKVVDDLYNMAANTPFDFAGILDNAKKILAYGFGQSGIKPILTSAGDASAALGKGSAGIESIVRALGQMKAKSKVSAEEMNQLMEVGVNGWTYVSQAMGKSVAETQKLSEKGLVPAKTAILAIVEGMEKDFPNMMGKQAQSMQGMWSTLKDTGSQVMGQITKPLFDNIKSQLPGVIEMVQKFGQGFSKGGIKGGIFAAFAPETAIKISKIIDNITASFQTLYAIAVPIATVLAQTAEFVAINWDKIAPIVVTLTGAWYGYKTAIEIATVAQTLYNAAAAVTLGPVGIAGLIVGLGAAGVAWANYNNKMIAARDTAISNTAAILKQKGALDMLSQAQLNSDATQAKSALNDLYNQEQQLNAQWEALDRRQSALKAKHVPPALEGLETNSIAKERKALDVEFQKLQKKRSDAYAVIQGAEQKPGYDAAKAAKELDKIKINMNDFNTEMDAWKKDFGGTMDGAAAAVEKSFSQLFGIFDKMAEKVRISPERLLVRLKSQVKNLVDWRANLQTLKDRGASGTMIEELRGLGLGAAGEVGALTRMSGSDWQQYQDLYNTRGAMSANPKNMGQVNVYINGPISSENDAEKYARQIGEKLLLNGT